ncbi:hypothetical protein Tco_0885947 [Tanacetum coccineum]
MKFPNVPSTSVKLMLFPFSLEESPIKGSFYGHCPHHGFSELHQLDTFYNALNSNDQDSLNSATSGNFLDKMPRDCLRIIESKSKVRNSRNKLVVAKVSSSTSTPRISSEVVELKDMVKALLLDKKNQSPAPTPVKAVEESCVTCGGAHSYQTCPATSGNVYRDNIQEYVSQAAAANYNQGNTAPVPQTQAPVYQAPAYQAPVPQTQGVSKTDFDSYIKANDAVIRNMQNQNQVLQTQGQNLQIVSLEVVEIVIPKVGGIDTDIILTIKDDILREKLLNVNLLIANIEALKDNPAPSSDVMTKSSSTSPNLFLEETNTFDNSLTESFCFDLEEISSGSTTTRSDYSLPDYEAFYDNHIEEKSSGSTTTHADFSQYDSFISLIFRSIHFLLPIGVIFIIDLPMKLASHHISTEYDH